MRLLVFILFALIGFLGHASARRDDEQASIVTYEFVLNCTVERNWCYEVVVVENTFLQNDVVARHPPICTNETFGGIQMQTRFPQKEYGPTFEPHMTVHHNCSWDGTTLVYKSWMEEVDRNVVFQVTPVKLDLTGKGYAKKSLSDFTKAKNYDGLQRTPYSRYQTHLKKYFDEQKYLEDQRRKYLEEQRKQLEERKRAERAEEWLFDTMRVIIEWFDQWVRLTFH